MLYIVCKVERFVLTITKTKMIIIIIIITYPDFKRDSTVEEVWKTEIPKKLNDCCWLYSDFVVNEIMNQPVLDDYLLRLYPRNPIMYLQLPSVTKETLKDERRARLREW